MTNIVPAIWFSRHLPTAEQVEDARARGFRIVGIEEGTRLGSRNIETKEDLDSVLRGLFDLASHWEANAIFGVFATPMLAEIAETAACAVLRGDWNRGWLACWASWNVARTPEGGRPTFSHKSWHWVGQIGLR